ncbi:MAG: hypothetical protein V1803_00645 [Candidatus Roizmanbacteria bacterium]
MIIRYQLPSNTVCLVKEGSKVDFQTPLLEKKVEKELEINVATELGIDPKNIFRYLKKLVGEKVEKDNLLGEKKGLFSTKKLFSPETGIIKEVDHHRGTLILITAGKDKNKILSPLKGEVEKVNKDSLQIKVDKGEEFTVKNLTIDFGGEVIYFEPSSSYDSAYLSQKIIFIDKINSYLQVKTEALGIRGYVTLEKLPEKTDVHSVIIKNLDDFKKIKKLSYSYCTVIAQSAKIYFYQ